MTHELKKPVVVVVVDGGEDAEGELDLGALPDVAVQVLDRSQSVSVVQVHQHIVGAEF